MGDINARAEILFLQRDVASADDKTLGHSRMFNTTEAHVAFPGGRMEPDDEGGLYTGAYSSFFCQYELSKDLLRVHSYEADMGRDWN